MIKITPFSNQGILEPILFYGLDFVFNPNKNLTIKTNGPFALFKNFTCLGLNWRVDTSEASGEEALAIKIQNEFSLVARVTRAILTGKPIRLFNETILTKNLKKEDRSKFALTIVDKIKEKKHAIVINDSETLEIRQNKHFKIRYKKTGQMN